MNHSPGSIFIVATPIGNLSDLSERAKQILNFVDLIACEDTRTTGLLLHHFSIKKPLESFHEANENRKYQHLMNLLISGKNIALVSDAGTPLISDPGFPLIREAIKQNIKIESIPGPCAATNALVLSGFACEPFAFFGFLPQKDKKRRDLLSECANEHKTLIFYESPYRIVKTLKDIRDIFAERRVAVCREMTKKFEEVIRGSASDILKQFETREPKGEFVIVIEGVEK